MNVSTINGRHQMIVTIEFFSSSLFMSLFNHDATFHPRDFVPALCIFTAPSKCSLILIFIL